MMEELALLNISAWNTHVAKDYLINVDLTKRNQNHVLMHLTDVQAVQNYHHMNPEPPATQVEKCVVVLPTNARQKAEDV